ncbi:MAG: hypothetical protein LCH98_19175 [Actinobacteria bacterium]|nr:hypothetical protein [Actinomycetota bacterium]
MVLWAREQWLGALILGAILLGTAGAQWFAWLLIAGRLAALGTGDGRRATADVKRDRWGKTVSALAMPLGAFMTGLVLFIAGSTTDNDRISGPGLSVGLAGAVLFVTLLIRNRKHR